MTETRGRLEGDEGISRGLLLLQKGGKREGGDKGRSGRRGGPEPGGNGEVRGAGGRVKGQLRNWNQRGRPLCDVR